jgi:hypothetical protein
MFDIVALFYRVEGSIAKGAEMMMNHTGNMNPLQAGSDHAA